jgi:N-acetylmuramoyl-L-alanine amidase
MTMKIENHKLKGHDGKFVTFEKTTNMGGKLTGGKPRFLIMHYTAGGTASGAISTFKNTAGSTSAHLVIDHDGTITQMVPFDTVAWHAGKSRWKGVDGINSCSIGIEIVNWGIVKKDAAGLWKSWTGTTVPADRVVLEQHKHFPAQAAGGWEIFDEAQISTCIDIARTIVSHYGMSGWDLVGHDDISPLRKVDPGPVFDMDNFRAKVFGEQEDAFNDALFEVNSPEGLKMREAGNPGSTVIKNLPNKAKVNVIERSGKWWLVAEIKNGNDDVTGFVHSNWLIPSS